MTKKPWRFLDTAAAVVGTAVTTAVVIALCAATTPNVTILPQTPNRGVLQFTSSSSAGTYATLYTAGANGSKCTALWEDNNDGSVTHLMTVQLVNAAVKYGGIAIQTAVSDGFANGVPTKNFMSPAVWPGLPLDNNGNPYLALISGDTIQATFVTAITATDQVDLHIVCADY